MFSRIFKTYCIFKASHNFKASRTFRAHLTFSTLILRTLAATALCSSKVFCLEKPEQANGQKSRLQYIKDYLKNPNIEFHQPPINYPPSNIQQCFSFIKSMWVQESKYVKDVKGFKKTEDLLRMVVEMKDGRLLMVHIKEINVPDCQNANQFIARFYQPKLVYEIDQVKLVELIIGDQKFIAE